MFLTDMEPKHYYLPPYRSTIAGALLMLVGVAFSLMGIDIKQSLWFNLQRIFISFEGVTDFFFSLFMLLFKVGFIAGGFVYIKYADGVERARLDDKGFYYREIPKGSGMSKMSIDLGPLTFAPYSAIHDLTYRKTFWSGGQLTLTLDSGIIPLTALGVLKDNEKLEIFNFVKSKLS